MKRIDLHREATVLTETLLSEHSKAINLLAEAAHDISNLASMIDFDVDLFLSNIPKDQHRNIKNFIKMAHTVARLSASHEYDVEVAARSLATAQESAVDKFLEAIKDE
jgi:hypothetical protein